MGILLDAAGAAAETEVPVNGTASFLGLFVFWILLFGVMWFFMLRPQSKEKKRIAAMLSTLAEGDSVLTTSGFYGTVISIEDDDTVIVEFGNNKNCRIPMEKAAISRVEKAGE